MARSYAANHITLLCLFDFRDTYLLIYLLNTAIGERGYGGL